MMLYFLGLTLVALSGLGTGSGAWPFKLSPGLRIEKYLLFWITTALLIVPWTIVLGARINVGAVIESVGLGQLLLSNLFAVGWGFANVLYFVCILRIGVALTGAILSALGMAVGVLLPLIVKGSGEFQESTGLFSFTGLLVIAGVLVIAIGIVLTTIAGVGRQKQLASADAETRAAQASGHFWSGFLLVVLAGALSAGLSLSFVYSNGPIVKAVEAQGGGQLVATVTVWALAAFGGVVVNVLFACSLLTKNKQWGLLFKDKREILFAILSGLQFAASIICLGQGMLVLGALGASVGYGIQQSTQVIGNQLVGFIGGEWKGVYGTPRKMMYVAIAIILFAVVIFSCSKAVG